MAEYATGEEPVIESRSKVSLKILQPDLDVLCARSTGTFPADILLTPNANLRPVTG